MGREADIAKAAQAILDQEVDFASFITKGNFTSVTKEVFPPTKFGELLGELAKRLDSMEANEFLQSKLGVGKYDTLPVHKIAAQMKALLDTLHKYAQVETTNSDDLARVRGMQSSLPTIGYTCVANNSSRR